MPTDIKPPTLDYLNVRGEDHGEPADPRLGPSILAFVILWPVGAVALAYSLLARSANARGDYDAAHRYATSAVNWGVGAMIAWLFLIVGWIFAVVVLDAGQWL